MYLPITHSKNRNKIGNYRGKLAIKTNEESVSESSHNIGTESYFLIALTKD